MDDEDGDEQAPPPLGCAERSPSPSELGEELRVHANKNRLVQVRRTGGRKLFDTDRRETFLEWFAATCNVVLSAQKAGVHYRTVYRHRMNDAAFASAWDRALAQGYARVEARLLQEVCGEEPVVHGDFDDPEVEERFDPQLALQLLREHSRRVAANPAERRGKAGAAPRAASNAEVVEALVKRLKAFAVRQQAPPRDGEVAVASATDGGGPLHHSASPSGPPPRSGEEL